MVASGGPSFCVGCRAVAGFETDEEMKAEGPARRGMRAADGFATRWLALGARERYWVWEFRDAPRNASAAVDLAEDIMSITMIEKDGREEK